MPDELLKLNGSSGGARPKIVAWGSEDKTKIIHGGAEMPEGYSPWMIKFSEAQDGRDCGAIEYLCSVIAKRAGIEMPETHLFASAVCPGYFGVKRFDRIGVKKIPVHTACGLLHAYLFGGLYDFAGQIRTMNISKGGFTFVPAMFLTESLKNIEAMPNDTFDAILDKYVEMNMAHPFREGNGRATRIWLDMTHLKRCGDWSRTNKNDYLQAMTSSVSDSSRIRKLILDALTDQINDREMFMKGIDYSY